MRPSKVIRENGQQCKKNTVPYIFFNISSIFFFAWKGHTFSDVIHVYAVDPREDAGV